jgi:heterogeneous nuclear ribonucleoprotein A1/A3
MKNPLTTCLGQLKAYFEAFGKVKEVKVMKDKRTKMPKGYGFVIFKNMKTFERIKDLKHLLNGRTLDINIGCKKEANPEMVENR